MPPQSAFSVADGIQSGSVERRALAQREISELRLEPSGKSLVVGHPSPESLYRSSVVVTGSFYSTTTLLGAILAQSPHFNLVHEPLNFEPPLSFRSVGTKHWYEYYDEARYA